MDKLRTFQEAAHKNGFTDVEETEDGTVWWLRKASAAAEDRMCIDSLTNSVTVFWATIPWKIHSKTFRTLASLEEWFAFTYKESGVMNNREALLRLATDKNDRLAITWLCENNADVIRLAIIRYFKTGPDSEHAQSVVMHRVAEHARSYATEQDADQWLAQSVNSECDRLRNETIQQKANRD